MKEVFLVEDQGRFAVFAPLRGLIMEVGTDEQADFASLIDRPGFSFRELVHLFPEIEGDRLLLRAAERDEIDGTENAFRPSVAVLFTTFNCQLRCVYCYANAGVQKTNMKWEVAKATIDFIISNAVANKDKEVFLYLHGGGEPTRNWNLFKAALDYFQEEVKAHNLEPRLSLATNGMLSPAQIEWVAERMKTVQVSLDGTSELQDRQRPTVSGRGSATTVFRTIDLLLARGVEVVIHSVVTEAGMAVVPETVRFLVERFPKAKTIHLEPACPCGRGLTTGQQFPSSEFFVRGFIEAQRIAEPAGIEVFYSGAGPYLSEYHRRFCGVVAPNFVVTPDGLVTACHEAAELNHPLAHHFIYGHLDFSSGNFVLDYEKIEKLRSYARAVDEDALCRECFARFYCAGDCLAKSLNSGGERSASLNPRCVINRELTRHYIFQQLFRQEGEGG